MNQNIDFPTRQHFRSDLNEIYFFFNSLEKHGGQEAKGRSIEIRKKMCFSSKKYFGAK